MCEKYAVLYVYRCGHQCAYYLLYAAREIGLPAMPRDDRGRGIYLSIYLSLYLYLSIYLSLSRLC